MEATAEMHQFALLRASQYDASRVETAFLSMASPSLPEVLTRIAESGARHIVVQPHLLFGGLLIDRVAETVRYFASRYSHAQWRVAGQLGPSELIVQAATDRALAAFQ
jgi:sirohydrochlorin cobaltochelatase